MDWCAGLRKPSKGLGVELGAIDSNTFPDEEFKLVSLAGRDFKARQASIGHHLDCTDVMNETEWRHLKIWFTDGSNYSGQDGPRYHQDNLADSLEHIYSRIGEGQRLVPEYKVLEPAFLSDPCS